MNPSSTKEGTRLSRNESMGEILDFMQGLWALDHGLQSHSKRMRQRYGITGPRRLVIRLVGKFPGIAAGELADQLHLHPSTLTGVFRRLEADGFLKRVPDPQDSRRALFHLTAKGQKVNNLREGTVEEVVRRAFLRIPAREVAAARKVLSILARDLSAQE
jgi:DNA-binding MarR family transcriptional regulator